MVRINFFDYPFTAIDGGPLVLGKPGRRGPILLVNTASECGLTPQYKGMEELHQKFASKGLAVVGAPCNDFGAQEPGSEAAVAEFCETRYGVSFPLTSKIHVKGENAHPLYDLIGRELGEDMLPQWNFHKYLFDASGQYVEAFGSKTEPTEAHVVAAIEKLLLKQQSDEDNDD